MPDLSDYTTVVKIHIEVRDKTGQVVYAINRDIEAGGDQMNDLLPLFVQGVKNENS